MERLRRLADRGLDVHWLGNWVLVWIFGFEDLDSRDWRVVRIC